MVSLSGHAGAVCIQEAALAAHTNLPEGLEYGLEDVTYYYPPNLTFPYGSYVVVVDVDPDTGVWKVRRMVALDDCGARINPMIVEGQIHGGLTEGLAMSSMQWITAPSTPPSWPGRGIRRGRSPPRSPYR